MITALPCSNLISPGVSRHQEWLPGDGCRPPVFYSFLAGGWIHAYRINTRSQMRANCTAVTMTPICCHVKLKSTTFASRSIRRVKNAIVVYRQLLIAHDKNPVRAVPASASKSSSRSISMSGGGHPWFLRILANDLVHALTAKLKLIGDLAQRLPARTKIQYQRIALNVGRWSWLEWSPLPTRNSLELRNSGLRKKSLLAALSHVADPGSKGYLSSIDDFNVSSRHIAMQLSRIELNKCFFIKFESGVVVHRKYNSANSYLEL